MSEYFNNSHVEYLKKIKFEKRLKLLEKKLDGKRIVIYGGGSFFRDLYNCYDLTKLNIVAIADKAFIEPQEHNNLFGYPICSPAEISLHTPDYILVGTLNFVEIMEDLELQIPAKIKIRPLIKKPIIDLWKDVFGLTC